MKVCNLNDGMITEILEEEERNHTEIFEVS